ncbi:MAG: PilN domain-containing protein [Burkholderiaceae bacterium]|jgi:type IV pilus assembly protein PilN|nr:PilN domain-containing protein [Burkholderiaceae bacterium]
MAIRINLLPHREARRERQKKLFWFFTGLSFVAGAALVGMVWTVLQGYIGNQIERNEFISAENRKLDNQIKEIATLRQEIDALRARQRAVEDLQADRNQPVYMLSELTRQTPEGIYLRAIKQEGNKVNVAGWAASNERVSEYLRNLQNNSPYVERPELIEIKVAGQSPQGVQRRLFEFSLNFFMRPTPERAQLQSGKTAPRPAPAAGAPVAQTAQK